MIVTHFEIILATVTFYYQCTPPPLINLKSQKGGGAIFPVLHVLVRNTKSGVNRNINFKQNAGVVVALVQSVAR